MIHRPNVEGIRQGELAFQHATVKKGSWEVLNFSEANTRKWISKVQQHFKVNATENSKCQFG